MRLVSGISEAKNFNTENEAIMAGEEFCISNPEHLKSDVYGYEICFEGQTYWISEIAAKDVFDPKYLAE